MPRRNVLVWLALATIYLAWGATYLGIALLVETVPPMLGGGMRFLVAGLVWGLVSEQDDVQVFFLLCVIVAGVYGAATVSMRILLVQAVPALLALGAVLLAR